MFFTKSSLVAALSVALFFAGQATAQEKISDPITACKGLKEGDKCHYLYLDGDVVREFDGHCIQIDNNHNVPLRCANPQ
ncbi:hypothetical protein PM082_012226 [Marasmius tenuissimus]|nr:hypothetical protein PM082_012226 [Marasmius tenuissimus]